MKVPEHGRYDIFCLLSPAAALLALPFVLMDAVALSFCGAAVLLAFVGLVRVTRNTQRGMGFAFAGMAMGIFFAIPVLMLFGGF